MTARAPLPAVLAAALALAAPARGGEASRPQRTALDPLRVTGVSPALAEAVEERLCAAIGEAAGGEVVCPDDVAAAAALARSAMMFGECRSDECLRRVEAARSADRRVTGALERGDRGIVLSLQVASAGGPGPHVVEKLPEDLDALVSRIPEIVKKLLAER